MNWDAIGAIGELLGATAVLVTLIYLSIQVRNTKAELRRSFLQNRDNSLRELLLEPARNPDMRKALAKARTKVGGSPLALETLVEKVGLSDEEATSILGMQIAWWFYRLEVIENLDQLSDAAREDFDFNIRFNYGSGVGKIFWDAWRPAQPDDHPAVSYVSKVLEGDA